MGSENVCRWLCDLKIQSNDESTARLEINVPPSKTMIVLCAESFENRVYLRLWLEPKGSGEPVSLAELGTCVIEGCSAKEMQQNLLPLFSELCICAFLGMTRKDMEDFKMRGSKKRISKEDSEELLRLEIEIEAPVYEQAFNTLFYAAWYSLLIRHIEQDNEIEYYRAEREKFIEQDNEIEYYRAEREKFIKQALQIIGPDATEGLMKSLVSKTNRFGYEGVRVNELRISHSLDFSNSWSIRCYCPLQEMERKSCHENKNAGDSLEYALSHQLLQCNLRLDNVVHIQADCIEVELRLFHLHCRALPVRELPNKLNREWYFPAKFGLTMGPECKSGVYDLSLGVSSSNPSTSVSTARTNELAFQVQMGSLMPVLNVRYTDIHTTTSTHERKNWHCDLSKPTETQARVECTLYDNSHGLPVFSHTSSCNCREHYKAFKALAEGLGSGGPFTPDGGIIFEGDTYGTPITWRLKKDLKGESLKWTVEVEIWLAYYANEYPTKYWEVRYQKFTQVVELSLVQSTSTTKHSADYNSTSSRNAGA